MVRKDGRMSEMKYYITGDCHGQFGKINWFFKHNMQEETCTMILLGDTGLNYWLNKTDKKNKKLLSEYPVTFLIIHGNHEARAEKLEGYKQKEWNGGIVLFEESYPNLLFAVDGEVYQLGDKKAMAIGGAYSVDKHYRISHRLPWWEDEQPSDEIKSYVEKQLDKYDWKIDYIFSHTAPLKFEPKEMFLDVINQDNVDKTTEIWLSEIEQKLSYEKWWFGHYHGNKEYEKACLLYEEIRELGDNKCVQKVGRPKYNKGDTVEFSFDNGKEKVENYGYIRVVDGCGTFGQTREVSYDIISVDNILYKHILESEIKKFEMR